MLQRTATSSAQRARLILFAAAAMVGLLASVSAANEYEGTYKIMDMFKDGIRVSLPERSAVALSLQQFDEQSYSLSIKAANRLSAHLVVVDTNAADSTNTNHGSGGEGILVKAGPVRSTRMMAPPELQPVERFFAQELETLQRIVLLDGDSCTMDNCKRLKLIGTHMEVLCEQENTVA